ncbi:MAG: PIN domain-containing protein [Candidatus Thorarchaeota archaeon]
MSIMPLSVVIDTNFIAVPAQFGVDIFAEAERVLERKLEFIILSSSLNELKRKLDFPTSKTEERHFRIALELVNRCTIVGPEGLPSIDNVDDQILEYTRSVEGVLATNDRALKKKAKAFGVPVLILRGQKQLVLDGSVL